MAEKREAKYKIGDIVTIKRVREKESSAYRFSFTDIMVKENGGKSYKIRSVIHWSDDPCKVPDDGYMYNLEKDGDYTWASSMFEDPNESLSCIDEISDGSIDAFIRTKKCPKLDFNL